MSVEALKAKVRQGQQVRAPSLEEALAVRDEVVRRTGLLEPGGLRVRFGSRLDHRQGRRLCELTWKDDLSESETREWEGLVEAGSGHKGVFREHRESARTAAATRDLYRRVVARSFSKGEVSGIFDTVAEHLTKGWLNADTAGLLMLVLIAFHNGTALTQGQIELDADGGPVLVLKSRESLIGGDLDPFRAYSRWQHSLDHLARNRWLTVERERGTVRIKLGPRAIKAMK
jgi:hypothetical protein